MCDTMFFADRNKINFIHLTKIILNTAFLIQFLKLFKSPNKNGSLNAYQQQAFI
jgi:hypothetical protein